jgi:hypothetical protein
MPVKPVGGCNKRVQLAGCIHLFLEWAQYARMQFCNGTEQAPAPCGYNLTLA